MGNEYISRYSLRYVSLILTGLLLAAMAILAGPNSSNPTAIDTSVPPVLADHTGGATGSG